MSSTSPMLTPTYGLAPSEQHLALPAGAMLRDRHNRRKALYYGCVPARILLATVILVHTSILAIWMLREYYLFDFKCAILQYDFASSADIEEDFQDQTAISSRHVDRSVQGRARARGPRQLRFLSDGTEEVPFRQKERVPFRQKETGTWESSGANGPVERLRLQLQLRSASIAWRRQSLSSSTDNLHQEGLSRIESPDKTGSESRDPCLMRTDFWNCKPSPVTGAEKDMSGADGQDLPEGRLKVPEKEREDLNMIEGHPARRKRRSVAQYSSESEDSGDGDMVSEGSASWLANADDGSESATSDGTDSEDSDSSDRAGNGDVTDIPSESEDIPSKSGDFSSESEDISTKSESPESEKQSEKFVPSESSLKRVRRISSQQRANINQFGRPAVMRANSVTPSPRQRPLGRMWSTASPRRRIISPLEDKTPSSPRSSTFKSQAKSSARPTSKTGLRKGTRPKRPQRPNDQAPKRPGQSELDKSKRPSGPRGRNGTRAHPIRRKPVAKGGSTIRPVSGPRSGAKSSPRPGTNTKRKPGPRTQKKPGLGNRKKPDPLNRKKSDPLRQKKPSAKNPTKPDAKNPTKPLPGSNQPAGSRKKGPKKHVSGESWESNEAKPTKKRYHFLSGAGGGNKRNGTAHRSSWFDGIVDPSDEGFSNKGDIRFYRGKVAKKKPRRKKIKATLSSPTGPMKGESPDSRQEKEETHQDESGSAESASRDTEKQKNASPSPPKSGEAMRKAQRKWKSAEDVHRRPNHRVKTSRENAKEGSGSREAERTSSESRFSAAMRAKDVKTSKSPGTVESRTTTTPLSQTAATTRQRPTTPIVYDVIGGGGYSVDGKYRQIQNPEYPYHSASLGPIPRRSTIGPMIGVTPESMDGVEVERPMRVAKLPTIPPVVETTTEMSEEMIRMRRENFVAQLQTFSDSALCIARTLLDLWCVAECLAAIPFFVGIWFPTRCLFAAHIILDTILLVIAFIYSVTLAVYSVILYMLVDDMSVWTLLQWLGFAAAIDVILGIYVVVFVITLRCCELVVDDGRNLKPRRHVARLQSYQEVRAPEAGDGNPV